MSARRLLPVIDPPLLNSSNLWATTEEELTELYHCPYTGAVTIRTSLLQGFNHDDRIHQHCFFNASSGKVGKEAVNSTLNTIGYSPITLQQYVDIIQRIVAANNRRQKPVIFSVTGTATEVADCLVFLDKSPCKTYAMMEINLSCPNILNKPPPAYSATELKAYLTALPQECGISVGLKLPPYTYHDQFVGVISALSDRDAYPISFLTSTNTLGSSLILDPATLEPVLSGASGTGLGGLAGTALHPLALGNVKTLRTMLDKAGLDAVQIIGTGGVSDHAGFLRMKKVGAWAIGVGTAFGADGVNAFKPILED